MNGPDNAEEKPPESTIGGNMGQGKGSDVIASETQQKAQSARLKALEKARTAPRKPRKKGKSLRKAINEYCKWCIYDPLSGLGTWQQQVRGCTSTECPLYDVRIQPREKGNED